MSLAEDRTGEVRPDMSDRGPEGPAPVEAEGGKP
jgi:hypothetical protein